MPILQTLVHLLNLQLICTGKLLGAHLIHHFKKATFKHPVTQVIVEMVDEFFFNGYLTEHFIKMVNYRTSIFASMFRRRNSSSSRFCAFQRKEQDIQFLM